MGIYYKNRKFDVGLRCDVFSHFDKNKKPSDDFSQLQGGFFVPDAWSCDFETCNIRERRVSAIGRNDFLIPEYFFSKRVTKWTRLH